MAMKVIASLIALFLSLGSVPGILSIELQPSLRGATADIDYDEQAVNFRRSSSTSLDKDSSASKEDNDYNENEDSDNSVGIFTKSSSSYFDKKKIKIKINTRDIEKRVQKRMQTFYACSALTKTECDDDKKCKWNKNGFCGARSLS